MYFRTNKAIETFQNATDFDTQVRLGLCPVSTKTCEYPAFTIPPSLRGPSGEQGQILLEGITKKISLYHGFWTEFDRDRELDWHVHIDLLKNAKQTLITHLRSQGCNITDKNLEDVYSEHMVLDSPNLMGDDPGTRQLGFRSADVSLALRLFGSTHPAWDLGLIAGRHQHKGQDFSKYSRLYADRGCAYLQGAFVNDAFHDIQLEIHPLDSIAFAIDKQGKTLSVRFGDSDWPTNHVRWRVAFFTNSTLHRVNKCSSLQKARTTTWFLGLPSDAVRKAGARVDVVPIRHKLWNGVRKSWYESRGVKSTTHSLQKDPKDGLMKLKVTATMNPPDKLGGIFVRDYLIQTS
jgi:hypothetical protein